jgi:RND family efflux transporter MFP subunit
MIGELNRETEPTEGRPVYLAGSILVVSLVALAAGLLLAQHLRTARELAERRRELAAGPTVVVARATMGPEADAISLACDVRPYRSVRLFPKIDGYLRELNADKGQTVRANQILGIIESREAENTLRSAKVALELKRRVLDRQKTLRDTQLTSAQDLESATGDAQIAELDVARLEALRAYQFLRSPFDGVVVSRSFDPGALLVVPGATDGARAVLEIWDTSRVRVQAYVGLSDASFVHAGDAVKIWTDARPQDLKQAKITRTSQSVDPRTRTMLVEVELDNRDGALLAGSYAHMKVALKVPRTVAVPVEALMLRGGEPFVAAVKGGRATVRPVRLGRTDGRLVRVLSGVSENEMVALFPGEELADGAHIRAVLGDGRPAE